MLYKYKLFHYEEQKYCKEMTNCIDKHYIRRTLYKKGKPIFEICENGSHS